MLNKAAFLLGDSLHKCLFIFICYSLNIKKERTTSMSLIFIFLLKTAKDKIITMLYCISYWKASDIMKFFFLLYGHYK